MSLGKSVKRIFEITELKLRGADLTIYQNWNSPEMSAIESRAIKESETIFAFPVNTQIEKDDVIQVNNGRSFWRVLDIDDDVQYGTVTNLNVRVMKIDRLGNEISINSQGRAVFNAPVYGGVQVGGQNNTQNNIINVNPEFSRAIEDLLALIEKSSLNPVQKISLRSDIQTVQELARLEESVEVVELANSKIEAVKEVISMTADMTSLGMILIQIIKAAF